MIDLKNVQRVHFIGIGGIGMSAIARMFLLEGKTVTGSDREQSLVTDVLSDLGANITIGHRKENLADDTDLVVYTIAIDPDNPELVKAQALGKALLTYPEALGEISKGKYTIAVTGAHGKTTTTGMIAQILLEHTFDPSVIIGSFLKGYKSNFIAGKSKYFVVESCEYRRSFLNMHPNILVITNIEEEHLDYYKDLADIQDAFRTLAERVPRDGFIICDPENEHVKPVIKGLSCTIVDYTKENVEATLQVPGAHMVKDAQAAQAAVKTLGVTEEEAGESLARFSGTWRRSDRLGETKNGATVFDDYAHHPDEIETTLAGFKERFDDKNIVVVFMPHLYSRTKIFFDRFVDVLSEADEIIVTNVYDARVEIDHSVTGEVLAETLKKKNPKTRFIADFGEIAHVLETEYGKDDLILTMGAGDIYKVAEQITDWQK